jgi:hypothetical protein
MCNLQNMADFSNIDVEKLIVTWEEEDIWNISGKSFYSYLVQKVRFVSEDLYYKTLLCTH